MTVALTACRDTVDPPPAEPSAVVLDAHALLLHLGESARLNASVYDDRSQVVNLAVEWQSRAPTIASTDATGNVTAGSPGRTWIVASVARGARTASDSAEVLVVPVGTSEQSLITTVPSAATLTVGDSVTFLGAAMGTFRGVMTWSVADTMVARPGTPAQTNDGMSRIVVRAVGRGTTLLTLTSANGLGTATASIVVQ